MDMKVLLLLALYHFCDGQQDLETATVPTFSVGTFFPSRSSLNAIQTEEAVCRPITDRIDRNSPRFRNELVSNSNGRITFQTADSRLMSSRMQSRLDALEVLYRPQNRRITVLKAWTPYPDPELSNGRSLHYEGRSVSVRLPSGSNYNTFLRRAVEAGFDWVFYEASNRARLTVIPSNCARNIDLVFMLDRSGSVGRSNHMIALDFMNAAVSFFTIGLQNTRVGVVPYSSTASVQFDLDRHSSLSSLENAISGIGFTGGATNTPAAINMAQTLLNPTNNRGARPNSEGIPKIAILITDGRSNRGNLNTAVAAIRDASIQVYAIGIGNINRQQLQFIASDPDDEHVFILSNYLDAAAFVDFLSVTTCDTPAIVDPGDNTTTETPDGGTEYFQTSCSAFSNEVLVELTIISGDCYLYASATETNPGPLTMNTVSNETPGILRRTVVVPLTGDSRVVYIAIQGQTVRDTFTVVVWDLLFNPEEVFIDELEGPSSVKTLYNVQQHLTAATVGSTYRYTIVDGNPNGIFTVNSNGRLIATQALDFNRSPNHVVTIQAQNVAESCQRARIRVNIRVVSNSITFNSISPRSVSEEAAVGFNIVTVRATGGLGAIQYSITNGNSDQFRIDSSNGRVTVAQTLNFETTQSYSLTIQARSTGSIQITGTAMLLINVQDVNEPPSFTTTCARQSSGCSYTIVENSAATTLATIQATDPDLPTVANGMLRYQLTPPSTRFSIDNSGNLRFTTALDREMQSSYTFTLRVSDGCSGCALSVTTIVRITVTDVNDNAPVFTSNPATIQVSEDLPRNSAVAEYRATDADVGSNAEITFTLAQSNIPFSLSSSGTLSLTGPIDYEDVDMQSYSVTITAANPGNSQTTMTTSTIQILNVNDNTPVISGEPYEPIVAENSNTGTLVTTVTATDGDLEIHGQVRYTIISGNVNQAFALNSVTGALTVNSNIDRESVSSFMLVVRARDRGTPQTREDRTTIAVTVSDVNDNAPIFRPSAYSVQLREDLPVGRNVIRVLATDADQPNTANSNIAYSITSGNTGNAFTILSDGQIQISQSLDFETTPSYSLVVEGRDGGTPAMSSTATVAVTVINVNENPPTLTGDQSVEVSESTPQGTEIAMFQAQDQDQMTVTLSIASGNGDMRFEINSATGAITLVDSLDYETTTSYTLTIRASDSEQNTDSVLTVQVLDVNEFSPEFSGPSAYMVLEEQPAGTQVGVVMATDADRDAQVTYSFVGQNQASSKFNLDETSGTITTTSVLNREELTQVFIPPASRVTLQVAATDNGSPSRQSVRDYTITLVDINDNTPTFSESMYSNQLRENLPAGQEVFSATATDIDLGSNAEITYSFTLTNNQGSSNPFEIDQATGAITTTQSLDCELQPSYMFSITATDRGSPSRSSTVTGNLTLIDENDNTPQFSQDAYTLTVMEDRSPGIIRTFTATDADKGVNGELEYSIMQDNVFLFIEGQSFGVVFDIDTNTGALTNLNSFNFETSTQETVTIIATDKGLPRRAASATVVVNVVNVDEQPPIFQLASCRDATISEDVDVGTVLSTCSATDADSTAPDGQSPVTYSLTSTLFEVNSTSGVITTKAALDRETSSIVRLTVTATDSSGLTSTRSFSVTITDVNDNSPQFQSATYTYEFTAAVIAQQSPQILTLEATDPDLGDSGKVSYSINEIQRSSDTETLVQILAQDGATPPRTNAVTVTITFQSLCQLQTYTIDPTGGQLSAHLLCSVAFSPATPFSLTLGQTGVLSCTVVHNSPAEFQFLHDGNALTSPAVAQPNGPQEFTLTEITRGHSGEYACRASSAAGSLQAPASMASIQVIPTITTAPTDTTVSLGTSATFTCIASGEPTPTISWVARNQMIGEGGTLNIADIKSSDSTTYTCIASNSAGSTTSSARLVLFDEFHVVQVEISEINNPSGDGSCQYFDPTELVNSIQSVTVRRVVVAGLSGSDLCELTPCSPSPCKNAGVCSIKEGVKGNYECSLCRLGYTGVNCTDDVNECDQGVCGGNGVCDNTDGSFTCTCNQNFIGRRCQYADRCSANPCLGPNEVCVVTLAKDEGYQCVEPDVPAGVSVRPPTGVTPGQLDDFIQEFIDRALRGASSNQPTTRRKRQTTSSSDLITSCEPRFVSSTGDSQALLLVWVCPENETEPTAAQQLALCQYLFEQGVATECKPPNGEVMVSPTSPTLSATNVRIDLVFLDDNDVPVDAIESVKILDDPEVQKQLAQNGVMVASVEAQEPQPRPTKSDTNVGGIVGGVVGVVIGLALVVMVAVIVTTVAKKKLKEGKDRQIQKRERAQQTLATMEMGSSKTDVQPEKPTQNIYTMEDEHTQERQI